MEKKTTDPYDFLAGIIKHIDSAKANERKDFACTVIFNIIAHAGKDDIEMLGILECVKADVIKTFLNTEESEENITGLVSEN